MHYISVCSGIEAATVAWEPLGWKPLWFSEIDAFPCAVLSYYYPRILNLGDMEKINGEEYRGQADVMVGGTPCQSFSVAGLRKGMADPRGNLALVYLRLIDQVRPRWIVWENVPGVLSSDRGWAFGAFVGGLVKCGYGCAWRVLDAQHFGVPQRRRRVFVVGYLGDWRRAAAVLFERESMRRDTMPREKPREVAPTIPSRRTGGGGLGSDFDYDGGLIAHSLRGDGFDASEDGTRRVPPIVPIAFVPGMGAKAGGIGAGEKCPVLRGYANNTQPAVAFTQNQVGEVLIGDKCAAMSTNQNATGRNTAKVKNGMIVRRLTPRECERLQGFPDDYTLIPYRGKPAEKCPDGPRYRALGNSMAVPVMRWIGERIALADQAVHDAAV